MNKKYVIYSLKSDKRNSNLYFGIDGKLWYIIDNKYEYLTREEFIYDEKTYYNFNNYKWYKYEIFSKEKSINTSSFCNEIEITITSKCRIISFLEETTMKIKQINNKILAEFIPENSPNNVGKVNFLFATCDCGKYMVYNFLYIFIYNKISTILIQPLKLSYKIPLGENNDLYNISYLGTTNSFGSYNFELKKGLIPGLVLSDFNNSDQIIFGKYTLNTFIASNYSNKYFDCKISLKNEKDNSNIWELIVKPSSNSSIIKASFTSGSYDPKTLLPYIYELKLIQKTVEEIAYIGVYESSDILENKQVSLSHYGLFTMNLVNLFDTAESVTNYCSFYSLAGLSCDLNQTLETKKNFDIVKTYWCNNLDNSIQCTFGPDFENDNSYSIIAAFDKEYEDLFQNILVRSQTYNCARRGFFISSDSEFNLEVIPFISTILSVPQLLPDFFPYLSDKSLIKGTIPSNYGDSYCASLIGLSPNLMVTNNYIQFKNLDFKQGINVTNYVSALDEKNGFKINEKGNYTLYIDISINLPLSVLKASFIAHQSISPALIWEIELERYDCVFFNKYTTDGILKRDFNFIKNESITLKISGFFPPGSVVTGGVTFYLRYNYSY